MREYHRSDPDAVYLGSDETRCDLWSPVRTLSGVHCRILRSPDGDGWRIEDLESRNGTRVRGERLLPGAPVPIEPGERVWLGRTTSFEFSTALCTKLVSPADFEAPQPLDVDSNSPRSAFAAASEPTVTLDPLQLPAMGPAPEPAAADPRAGVRAANQPTMAIQLTGGLPFAPAPAAPVVSDDEDGDFDPGATSVGRARSRAAVTGVMRADPPSLAAVSLSIGFADSNDIVLANPVVSQRHARLYLDGERVLIEDQGSTNGTWVRNERVQLAELALGETFLLGSHPIELTTSLRARLETKRQSAQESQQLRVPFEPGRVFHVGRVQEGNDVVLAAPMVSSRHARLTVIPSGNGYLVEDLDSTNGTWLNNRDNRIVQPTVATLEDILWFGSYRLPLSRLPQMVAGGEGASDETVLPNKRVFVIGRDGDDVDIAIDQPQISRRHAEVTVLDDGRFAIRDLGSSNGIYVNGTRIRGREVVSAEDRVSLGSYNIRLDPVSGVVRQEFHGDIMLQAQRISIDVPDRASPGGRKRILNDCSFTVYPTEFVGLMGPSGAGKTTLMMALNGYLPPSSGRSIVNGEDLYANYNSFRGTIGYVPQDDIVYPQLTVRESLWYTARLRLPSDTSRDEIERKIDAILEKLEIQQTADVRIGDALQKGISGGQRKRVNLAQELITEPSLLFLDEPTSGLASEDTINVMRLLRGLADDGKTILLTIHQPSLEAYRLMDNVIYLFQGNLIYYGPTWPDSIRYFHANVPPGPELDTLLADPGNALKPLAAEQREAFAAPANERAARLGDVIERRRQRWAASREYKEFVYDRAGSHYAADVVLESGEKQKTVRSGLWRQWSILTARAALILRKDRLNLAILLVQAPVIATILAIVFANQGPDAWFERLERGPAALFLLVAAAVWFGCSNSAREIVSEQAIYRRERMVNLMIPSYVLSKFAVLGVVCALQCLLLLGIAWWPLGLTGSFALHYGILLLTSLAGLGMGLTLSALASSAQAAVALVPLLLIPQIILGGVIMPVHEMNVPMRVLSSTMAARWGYEAALHAEYAHDDLARIRDACGIPSCVWGVGPAGFTYYPGDPSDVAASAETAGVAALAEGVVPAVEPVSETLCHAFCPSVREGRDITPLDRSFGADPLDPVRMQAWRDIAVAGDAPTEVTRPAPTLRTSLAGSLGALAIFLAFLMGLVMSLLKARDVEVG